MQGEPQSRAPRAPAAHQVVERAAELCRRRGVRLTPQRRRVLEIICASSKPLGAYEILDAMRDGARGRAPPTVYRALEFLLEQGLIHKIESLHAFIGCNHPEHPHWSQFLICAECGLVTELDSEAIGQSLKSAAGASGFEPRRRVVELIGCCAECLGKPRQS